MSEQDKQIRAAATATISAWVAMESRRQAQNPPTEEQMWQAAADALRPHWPQANMTPERLAEIKARVEKATAGPWTAIGCRTYPCLMGIKDGAGNELMDATPAGRAHFVSPNDAELCAHAPTDIPDLIAAVESGGGNAGAMRSALQTMVDVFRPRDGEPGPDMHAETVAWTNAKAVLDDPSARCPECERERQRADEAEAKAAAGTALLADLFAPAGPMMAFIQNNPKWWSSWANSEQDPCGAHALLARYETLGDAGRAGAQRQRELEQERNKYRTSCGEASIKLRQAEAERDAMETGRDRAENERDRLEVELDDARQQRDAAQSRAEAAEARERAWQTAYRTIRAKFPAVDRSCSPEAQAGSEREAAEIVFASVLEDDFREAAQQASDAKGGGR